MTNKRLTHNKSKSQRSSATSSPIEDIFTYRKHSLDYFTVDGVILRTGYSNKRDWFLLCIRELLDNAVDFLSKNYKGADDTGIDIVIFKDDKVFRLKIRNSNYKNIPIFSNLDAIFDYDMRYGSKQDVHIISRGMLGDALKQILAFKYILIHVGYDEGSTFEDKQPKDPLIIRHNKRESKVYLNVDKVRQTAIVKVKETPQELTHSDTEIELVLPIIEEIKYALDRKCIEDFCKRYPLFTTDVTFRFHITDNSNYYYDNVNNNSIGILGRGDDYNNDGDTDNNTSNNKNSSKYNPSSGVFAKTLVNTALAESPKAIVNIEYQALHPISSEFWNKQNSVHSYTPEEFKRRIVNIDPKQAAKTHIHVYDILVATYREGSNLKRDAENEISLVKLLSLPDKKRNKKIECYYKQLQDALPPPPKLILPYTANKQQRKVALIERLVKLYDDLDSDEKKASYKSIHGYYQGTKKGITHPYFWEILAIPFADPIRAKKRIDFIGAINYSISPKTRGNLFEGEYTEALAYNPEIGEYVGATHILGVLEHYGFHEYATDSAKIPCLVVANLVTPRRDPHGQDKSRIDTSPFTETITEGVKRIASEIKSFRALGYRFRKPEDRRYAIRYSSGKKSLKDLLTDYLRKEHGLLTKDYNNNNNNSINVYHNYD